MKEAVSLGVLTAPDVRPLARLHRDAFPGFFLSTLGEPFLAQFYKGFLADDSAVTVVARSPDGAVIGAAVGTTEPAGFFGRLISNRWPGFVLASARAVIANPKAASRLFRAVRYRGDAPGDDQGALLSSICVDPARQGTGLGRQLVEAWTRDVAARGGRAAYLTTDADDNDAVNRFYRTQGWVLAGHYTTSEGRSMNRYSLTLDGS